MLATIMCQADSNCLAWKYPDDSISLGSQIIVNESQEALLFENGQLITILKPGRYLVESGNIPGLEAILAKAFGGSSPVIVQVWFVNKVASFSYKWGAQVQVRDNTYGLLVPLGARGSYGLRLQDPESFVLQMVGVDTTFTIDQARSRLLPLVERTLKDYIAEQVSEFNADVFVISARLSQISQGIFERLQPEMSRFGLDLVDFYVQGIDVVSDDPAFLAIKEGLAGAAALRVRAAAAADVGTFYQLERSLDALNAAAANEGGPAGALLAGGLGVGIGLGAGQQMGQSISNATTFEEGGSDGILADVEPKLRSLKKLLDAGLITSDDYDAKKRSLLDSI